MHSKFQVPDEFADLRFSAGGREYAFIEGALEVEEEADAKRVRTFAAEHPEWGIEDAEPGAVEGGDAGDNDDDASEAEASSDDVIEAAKEAGMSLEDIANAEVVDETGEPDEDGDDAEPVKE